MRMAQWFALIPVTAAGLLAQEQVQHDVVFTSAVPLAAGPIGAAAAGLSGTFNFVAGELVGGGVIKSAPYSADAVTENVQTLADGNRIVHNTNAKIYRDSQGRERREQTLPAIGPFAAQGEPRKTIFISDPVAGVNYSLDVQNKVAIKLPRPALPPVRTVEMPAEPKAGAQVFIRRFDGPGAPGVPPAPQVMFFQRGTGAPGAGRGPAPQTEQLGSKVIEGVSADGVRHTITIPAGQIGNERPIMVTDEVWRSPELQVMVQSNHSDPRMGTTTYSLRNVSRSEPSPTLFQVPPDYTVKEPPAPPKPVQAQ